MHRIFLLFSILFFIENVPGAFLRADEITAVCPHPGDVQTEATLRMDVDPQSPGIYFLGWDTEGGTRGDKNLLRSGIRVFPRMRIQGEWKEGNAFSTQFAKNPNGCQYRIQLADDANLVWEIESTSEGLIWNFLWEGNSATLLEEIELSIPFDPQVTPTTVLPSQWEADGTLYLPAVLNAPDFGQIRLSTKTDRPLSARLVGSRAKKVVDLILTIPLSSSIPAISLHFQPFWLSPIEGMDRLDQGTNLWGKVRRGWFGAFQPSAQWGDSGNPFSAPAGKLANNVISDPASCSIWFYADQAFWTPRIASDISVAALVRQTLDWWLDERTLPSGELICYWDKQDFLDANAGPLIAAWDYVESTGDREWLEKRIEKLEFISTYLEKRDIDGDGMVEAEQSGNRNSLQQPHRSCAWWDALNCGYKDGYTNALIYRAWRCLADLEAKLGRNSQQSHWTQLADRLQSVYSKTLLNPKSGWLAWWKSEDGELHDYASPVVNGLAIEYGLVEAELGREILAKIRNKIQEVGFTRFDLGIPPVLIPVPRSDYLQPDAIGLPRREDGTDTFGQYMNGGITAGQVLHFIAAHYQVGDFETGDRYFNAMLQRQARGEFQNGVRDAGGQGIDWTTWDGRPCGYEGYLADNFRFLQAVFLRDRVCRERYYRPLYEHP